MTWRSSAAAGAALIVSVAAVLVVSSEDPTPVVRTPARAEVRPVTAVTLSCPGGPVAPAPPTTVFAVGPNPVATPEGSRLKMVGLSGGTGSSRIAATARAAHPLRIQVPAAAAAGGVLVRASGTQAPGVTAAQVSTYATTSARGLTASLCEAPRDQWWFTGVDTGVGTSTSLVLTNPSPAVAVVNVRILGPRGPVAAAGSDGIAVGPQSRLVLDLARYAPGRTALTLHVSATRGTVTAGVSTTRLDGLTTTGADWLPASAPPAPDVVVDAGPAGVGRQLLVVTNAGTRQQVVSVRILDRDGAYTSTALPNLQVPPESVVVRDVSATLKKQPVAIELSSGAPVTGALVSEQVAGARDFAVSTVSEPLSTPAVVPLVNGDTLTLSFASSSPAPETVSVTGVSNLGQLAGTATVAVRGLATTTWQPPSDWGAAYLVVAVPPESDLHAAASYVGAGGLADLPLLSGRRTVVRPVVLP